MNFLAAALGTFDLVMLIVFRECLDFHKMVLALLAFEFVGRHVCSFRFDTELFQSRRIHCAAKHGI